MTKTIPSDIINRQDVGYVLLAQLSKPAALRLEKLLQELTTELPGIIWPMPAKSLHITLCEIIQPKDYGQSKEDLYALHSKDYENLSAEILSSFSRFKVTFNTLEASPNAIIARSPDVAIFNSIRSQLINQLPMPAETKAPPEIVHSSLARYTSETSLSQVQEIVTRHGISFEEEITEFKLLKVAILPLQQYEVIRTYPLI